MIWYRRLVGGRCDVLCGELYQQHEGRHRHVALAACSNIVALVGVM